jgi:hypothetical protein
MESDCWAVGTVNMDPDFRYTLFTYAHKVNVFKVLIGTVSTYRSSGEDYFAPSTPPLPSKFYGTDTSFILLTKHIS